MARWLVSEEAAPWLELAGREPEPSSLAAASRWRRRLPPERAAAVLDQAALRRRARSKLGEWADQVFLTRAGLEMATRADVARWRAARLVAAGVTRLTDAGTGLGIDALAGVLAGLDVRAIERDPTTAVLARANLARAGRPSGAAGSVTVEHHEVTDLATLAPGPGEALFVDPSRRTEAGPTWDIHLLTPTWEQVRAVLTAPADDGGAVVAKLGPGVAHRHIPETAAATWVSHAGDLVELSLWRGPWPAGERTAVLLPDGHSLPAGRSNPPPGPLGAFLFEPDPAVIRAGAVGELAERLGARPVAERIAYLTGDQPQVTPFASRFEVLEVLPYRDKAVRAWLRAHHVGVVEIKTRGLDLDPARWRRRLAPVGPNQATLVATPVGGEAAVLVARRVS